jgi:Protein of unknown function (DUF3421)
VVKNNTFFSSKSSGKPIWEYEVNGQVPTDAFQAGRDGNSIVYIAKAYHKIGNRMELIPGKRNSGHRQAYVSYHGEVLNKTDYMVLCGYAYYWMPYPSNYEDFPKLAVPGGKTGFGEVLYIGRIQHEGADHIVGKVILTYNN